MSVLDGFCYGANNLNYKSLNNIERLEERKNKMSEYVSYEVSKEVNDILGKYYCRNFSKFSAKCWRFSETGSGGHANGPEIDDFYYDDNPLDDYDDTIFAFTWNELYKLMNKLVDGDFRKAEFECIDNIDTFALELNKYLEEKMDSN